MTRSLRDDRDMPAVPLTDLAADVRQEAAPQWLLDRLAAADPVPSAGPDADPGVAARALAARHGRSPGEVLVTAGAAEALAVIARAMRPVHPLVIHPQPSAAELALRAAGHRVDRLVLRPPFELDTRLVPDEADLVVVGNPSDPTSVLHHREAVRALVRPHRLVVVDETLAGCVADETHSLADDRGVVVVRGLTPWAFAGARVGYVLAGAAVIERMRGARRRPVGPAALAACVVCSAPDAVEQARDRAARLASDRAHLAGLLAALPGADPLPNAQASFLLVRTDAAAIWEPLRERGFAVRPGDTFPGLGPHWFRVAVPDRETSAAFARALADVLR